MQKIPLYIETALEGISDGKRYADFNYSSAVDCVNLNYSMCGYNNPVVVVAENPLEMQLLFNYITNLAKNRGPLHSTTTEFYQNLRQRIQDPLLSPENTWLDDLMNTDKQVVSPNLSFNSGFVEKLNHHLFTRLYRLLFSELEKNMDPVLSAELDAALRFELRNKLGEQLGESVDQQVKMEITAFPSELNKLHPSYLFTMNFYSDCMYAWYEFLRKEMSMSLSVNSYFQKVFSHHRKSGICQAIFSRDLCVVSKYPKNISWDESGELHNDTEGAIDWGAISESTAFKGYYLEGDAVSLKSFEKLLSTRSRSPRKINVHRLN